tara:strand:+ start:532 stop:1059 length:528 start_codon:yes stop_codon:yes gene_type:complete
MSTIAIIALEKDDKSITSIICDSDGYTEHTGKILLENYDTKQRIEYLITHGSVSVLGPEIGKQHDFEAPREGWTWHSDYKKQTPISKKWCRFYHRDKRDELIIDNYKNEEELLSTYNNESWAEFIYIYKDKKWHVKQNNVNTYSILSEQLSYAKEIEKSDTSEADEFPPVKESKY